MFNTLHRRHFTMGDMGEELEEIEVLPQEVPTVEPATPTPAEPEKVPA